MHAVFVFVQVLVLLQAGAAEPPGGPDYGNPIPREESTGLVAADEIDLELNAGDQGVADALFPEQVRQAIDQLDDPVFERREQASDLLYAAGSCAVPSLQAAAESEIPEIAVRAFDLLQRLYFRKDEATYDAVDEGVQQLMRAGNLSAAARAESLFDQVGDVRQERAVAKLKRLGAIIHHSEPRFDQERSRIDYVMFGRGWTGSDDDVHLIERLEDLRAFTNAAIYVVRGVPIAEQTLEDLKASMPLLIINRRGPAQLGVVSEQPTSEGCYIKSVVTDSAADNAGLKPFDRIVEIDGRPVNSFENLIEIVGEKEPGDRVPVIFYRDNEVHEVEVKLQAWK